MTGPGGAFKLRSWEAEAEAGEVSEFKSLSSRLAWSMVYRVPGQPRLSTEKPSLENQSRGEEVGYDRKRKGRKDVIEGTEVAGN